MKKETIVKPRQDLAEGNPSELIFGSEGKTYTRRFYPPQRLILLGGGHISQALCDFAAELDFDVTVADDRPDFANYTLFPKAAEVICDTFDSAIKKLHISPFDYVAVLTRGHRWDQLCLESIFSGRYPSYLGLVGSGRRVSGLFDILEKEGFSRDLMKKVHTPIGLPIKAATPKEIAISILAELILFKQDLSGGNGALSLSEADPEVIDQLISQERSVLATVVETKGSVPAASGAMMVINNLGRCAGTVGGGCGEHEVLTKAREALMTGEPQIIELDMTNEVAENNGMVCGGTMKLWLEPCLP